MALNLKKYREIVVLTGAGVSAASGIPTFRGEEGIWNDKEVAKLSSIDFWQTDPLAVWTFWQTMFQKIQECQPNQNHLWLANLARQLNPAQKLTLLTQNVDGLHQKAGSPNVVELHGSLARLKCSAPTCSYRLPNSPSFSPKQLMSCPQCQSFLRADLVLFGESLPLDAEWISKNSLHHCDLFLALGTSGNVTPASNLVRSAEYSGAHTVYINLEPLDPPNPYFKENQIGLLEEILPQLFGI